MLSLIQVTLGVLSLLGNGYCEPNPVADLKHKVIQLSNDMYEILQLSPDLVNPMDGGLVVSPMTALAPLAKLKLFSSGLTKTQLNNILKLSTSQLKEISLPHLQQLASQSKNLTFMGYSKTFVQNGLNLSKEYLVRTETDFGEEVDHIDFRFPENAAKTINDWAYLKSQGILNNIASPKWIDETSEVLFVNVLYLKGAWKTEFKKNDIPEFFFGDGLFHIRSLIYMSRVDNIRYGYSNRLNADVVQLPFSDEDLEFILINSADYQNGFVLNVTKTLQEEPEVLEDVLKQSSPQFVDLRIPMVKLSSVINMKEALKVLGVSHIFDPRLANINKMFQNGYGGHISNMVQRVELDLDSEGVVAGNKQFPDGDVQYKAAKDVKVIKIQANRPFLFQIRFRGLPLFLGSYEGITRF